MRLLNDEERETIKKLWKQDLKTQASEEARWIVDHNSRIKQLKQLRIQITTTEHNEKNYVIQIFQDKLMIRQYGTFTTTDRIINHAPIAKQQAIEQFRQLIQTLLQEKEITLEIANTE